MRSGGFVVLSEEIIIFILLILMNIDKFAQNIRHVKFDSCETEVQTGHQPR